MTVLQANELLLAGNSAAAIERIQELKTSNLPFQAYTVLLEAYVVSGDADNAKAQATWLSTHRGRAYIEQGCGWCQQPLNVLDTTLGHLLVAELLKRQGRAKEAQEQLRLFDQRWPVASLPDHLRVRRTAAGAFN